MYFRVKGRDFYLRISDGTKKAVPEISEKDILKKGLESIGYYVNDSRRRFFIKFGFYSFLIFLLGATLGYREGHKDILKPIEKQNVKSKSTIEKSLLENPLDTGKQNLYRLTQFESYKKTINK